MVDPATIPSGGPLQSNGGRDSTGQSTIALQHELTCVRAQAQKHQEENQRLRALLDSFIAGKIDCHDSKKMARDVHSVDANAMNEAIQDYEHLAIKYNKLDETLRTVIQERDDYRQQRDRCKRHLDDYKQHYHRAKKNIKEWQTFYDNQKHKTSVQSRPAQFHSPEPPRHCTTPANAKTVQPLDHAYHRSLSPQLPPPLHPGASSSSALILSCAGASLPANSSEVLTLANGRPPTPSATSNTATSRKSAVTSSQSTADEAIPVGVLTKGPTTESDVPKQDSDPIEFVSERPVRRAPKHSRNPAHSRRKPEGDGSTAKPYKLKDEPVSQFEFPALPRTANNESLDLDEIPGYVGTPSRLNGKQQIYPKQSSRHDGSSQDLGRSSSMPADVQSLSSPREVYPLDERAFRSFNNLEYASDDVCQPASANRPGPQNSHVLNPLSVNEPMSARSSASEQRKRHLHAGIESLAEDGEIIVAKHQNSLAVDRRALTYSESKRRKIDALLEKPAPHSKTPIPAETSGQPPLQLHKSSVKPKQQIAIKRLRQLSPSALYLEDFRPNPKATSTDEQGYAYSETIRGRDAHRCLPGCTDPRCCGSAFAKMVSIGGLAPQVPRSIWDPLSQDEPAHEHDQRVEERRLLDWHIGHDDAAQKRISLLTRAQRKQAVVDARAALIADRHGKHRQAFARRTSPPGFWRTDMPTTQESKEDREKQKEVVRAKVREQWKEAMRGGDKSRWVFRDEL